MKQSNVKKFLKSYIIILACILTSFAMIFSAFSTNVVKAENLNFLTLSKLSRYRNIDGSQYGNGLGSYIKDSSVVECSSGDYIMLNNANLETEGGHYLEEAINLCFTTPETDNDTALYYLSVSATLNGKTINNGKVMTLDDNLSNNAYEIFLTPTHLTYCTTNDPATKYDSDNLVTIPLTYVDNNNAEVAVPYEEAQGLYEFTFSYRIGNSDYTPSGTSKEYVTKCSFYLLDEVSYINPNQAPGVDLRSTFGTPGNNANNNNYQYTEPRLNSVEHISRNLAEQELNYFNYNNKKTVDYYGASNNNSTKLIYPEYFYDASRYNISYLKTIYGVATQVDSQFIIEDAENKIAYVEFTHKVDGIVVKTEKIYCEKVLKTAPSTYYDGWFCKLLLSDVGLYEFNIRFTLNVYGKYEICDTLELVEKNQDLIGDVRLYIYGYQLYYTAYDSEDNNKSTQQEFKNDTLYTDTTFKFYNTSAYNNFLGQTSLIKFGNYLSFNRNSITTNFNSTVTTNQAPISLKFYSNLCYQHDEVNNKVNVYSFYTFKNLKGITTIKNMNNSTVFSENGSYALYIIYTFENYQYSHGGMVYGGAEEVHIQTFAFNIENQEPTVKTFIADYDIATQTGTATTTVINSNSYTNRAVYVNWKDESYSPFNAPVYASITYKRGLTVVKSYDIKKANSTFLYCGDNEYVEAYIDILYGPYYTSRISFLFIIDKQDISGINLLQVNKDEMFNKYLYSLKSNSYENMNNISFNDVSNYGTKTVFNSHFTLNWAEKASGSKITTKYTFLPLSKVGTTQYNNMYAGTDANVGKIYSSSEQIDENLIVDLNGLKQFNIENGYGFDTVNIDIPYTDTGIYSNSSETFSAEIASDKTNAVMSNEGLYVFTLTDSAGNSAQKIVLLDKSNPETLIALEGKNDGKFAPVTGDDFSSKNTTLLWGTHKTLTFDDTTSQFVQMQLINICTDGIDETTQIDTLLNGFYDISFTKADNVIGGQIYYVKTNNKYFMATADDIVDSNIDKFYATVQINIPITKVNEEFTNLNDDKFNYDRFNTRNKCFTYYNATEYDEASELYVNEGYHIYFIKDASYVVPLASNRDYNRSFQVEINLDNSQLKAFTSGNYETTGTAEATRLKVNASSNKRELYLQWIESVGEYAIESVVYNYYALTYDTSSPNYPYSSEPTNANVNVRTNISGTGLVRCESINVTYSELYNQNISGEGMYEVVRTYVGEPGEDSGDVKERRYLFYIDRTNIISPVNNNITIGDFIAIIMSENTKFSGLDYLKENGNYKLSTNKLPVELLQMSNKFVYSTTDVTNINNKLKLSVNYMENRPENSLYGAISRNGESYTFYSNRKINSYNLSYQLLKNVPITYADGTVNEDNWEVAPERNNKDGLYKILINDNTGTDKIIDGSYVTNISPINFEFTFRISNLKPDGSFVMINSDGTQTVISTGTTSINNTNFKFTWTDPIDEYTAKINANVITIDMYKPDGTSSTIYVKKETYNPATQTYYAQITTNTYNVEYRDVSGDQDISWDHELDFSVGILNQLQRNKTNCKLVINIQYEGDAQYYKYQDANGNLVDFYTNAKVLYLDFTAPEHNINIVKQNDEYYKNLSLEQKATFNNYDAEINFENFAFEVSPDWILTTAPDTDYEPYIHDTYKAYYRKYNKYNAKQYETTSENLQSLVPTDERYTNYVAEPLRYRFDAGLKDASGNLVYTQITYDLDNPIWATEPGYYEIIEQDEAGNFTVYTIHISSDPVTIYYDYVATDAANKVPAEWVSTSNISDINKSLVELTGLNISTEEDNFNLTSINPWFNIRVVDVMANTSTLFKFAPVQIEGYYNNLSQLLDEINELIVPYNTVSGNSFALQFSLHLPNDSFTLTINTPGAKLEPTFEDFAGFFVMHMPDDTPSTYIKKLVVYKAVDGKVEFGPMLPGGEVENHYIQNTYVYNENNKKNISYTYAQAGAAGSDYWFEFTDNFDRIYKVRKIFGITDEQYLDFSGNYEFINDEYYTSEQVAMRFQARLYTITIEKFTTDWEEIEPYAQDNPNGYVENTNAATGMSTINLIYFATPEDEFVNQKLRVSLENSAGNIYVYIINYYKTLAEVHLVDSFENELDIKDNGITTKNVYVIFDKNEAIFETFVSVTRTILNGEGFTEVTDIGLINNEHILDQFGEYRLTIYNSLGNVIEYVFTIKESVAAYYSVSAILPNGVHSNITAVRNPNFVGKIEDTFVVNNEYVLQYYTIYDYIIECNADKGIIYSEIRSIDENTKLYQLSSTLDANYKAYIVITKVPTNTMFLLNNLRIGTTEYAQSSLSSVKSNLKSVQVRYSTVNYAGKESSPTSYIYSCNTVSVKYDFNSLPIGYIDSKYLTVDEGDNSKTIFNITNAGTYNFYFTDLAGNKNLFGVNDNIRVILLNQVLFSINGSTPIDNSIYNSDVVLSIQQITAYDSTNVSVMSTLNGKSYIPTKDGLNYTYSGYGVFVVTLSAKVSGDTVTACIKFTILNPNEARYAFEYLPLNNYEIISITKGDSAVNLLPNILEEESVASLTNLTLSYGNAGVRGAGKYTITVRENSTSLKPAQEFTFNVWINSTTPIITLSIEDGKSTIHTIEVEFNIFLIYSTVGECDVLLNDDSLFKIDAELLSKHPTYKLKINKIGNYVLKLNSTSGNTLLTRTFTKAEPLNTIAIIVIILASLAVISLTIIFIKLRKNMRVK